MVGLRRTLIAQVVPAHRRSRNRTENPSPVSRDQSDTCPRAPAAPPVTTYVTRSERPVGSSREPLSDAVVSSRNHEVERDGPLCSIRRQAEWRQFPGHVRRAIAGACCRQGQGADSQESETAERAGEGSERTSTRVPRRAKFHSPKHWPRALAVEQSGSLPSIARQRP